MPYSKFIFIAICMTATTLIAHAGDLDDGIDFDKAINDDLKKETNFQYIIMKAKAQSALGASKSLIIKDGKSAGVGNINFGPGSRLRNVTVINTSNNKGAAAIGGK